MTQPTALFLADILEDAGKPADIAEKCAAELRRLHTEVEEQCRLNGMGSEREAKLLAENKALRELIDCVREQEIEACAKVCDAIAHEEIGMAYEGIALDCAAAIRARGNT